MGCIGGKGKDKSKEQPKEQPKELAFNIEAEIEKIIKKQKVLRQQILSHEEQGNNDLVDIKTEEYKNLNIKRKRLTEQAKTLGVFQNQTEIAKNEAWAADKFLKELEDARKENENKQEKLADAVMVQQENDELERQNKEYQKTLRQKQRLDAIKYNFKRSLIITYEKLTIFQQSLIQQCCIKLQSLIILRAIIKSKLSKLTIITILILSKLGISTTIYW